MRDTLDASRELRSGLIEAKLRPPGGFRASVPRDRLLQRLRPGERRPLVTVTAPAGYGKTNLLAQWATAQPDSTGWLTLDELDNDPATFLTYLCAAVDRVAPLPPTVYGEIASRVRDRRVVGHLVSALASLADPLLLVIDDAHHLHDRASLDALAELITYLPDGACVAMVGRDVPALPLERWRLQGRVSELGPADLAMDRPEAGRLLDQLGIESSEDAIHDLVEYTTGWPALIALIAFSIGRTGEPVSVNAPLLDPALSAYLRSELLEPKPAEEVEFLLQTSILDRLNAEICDAILERQDSGGILRSLADSTLLVDEYGGWYRYHPLLRRFLTSELDRRMPGRAAVLHRRASSWHESAGDTEGAVESAFLAHDSDLAASIVGRSLVRLHWSGRRVTVHSWLARFDERDLHERPWLAALAAWEELSEGDLGAMERYMAIAEQGTQRGPSPDGSSSLEAARAMLRSVMGFGGGERMLANATFAVELEGAGSPWRSFALWLQAIARHALGRLDATEETLIDATIAARGGHQDGLVYCLLGHRALLCADRGDWDAARELLRQADAIGIPGRLEGYLSSTLARVASIRLLQHAGDPADVRRELAGATVIRPMLTAAAPAISVLTLLGLARIHLAVGDPAGVRSLLAQAQEIDRRRPGLGVLPSELAALRATVASLPIGLAGASTLTAAELRVLALLPYYLSFKEIGQRLGVKSTTVKSHALSIYGKLGAASRSDAIDRAAEAGLLERIPAITAVSPIAEDALSGSG